MPIDPRMPGRLAARSGDQANTQRIVELERQVAALMAIVSRLTLRAVDTEPAAPDAGIAQLYTRENGGGKLELVAVFPTGTPQILATEP